MWCPLLLAFAACGDNLAPPPDAIEFDASAPDVPADAPPDAPDCWRRVVVQCVPEELIQLCVPLDGCAFYTCAGEVYGYCGPGSG